MRAMHVCPMMQTLLEDERGNVVKVTTHLPLPPQLALHGLHCLCAIMVYTTMPMGSYLRTTMQVPCPAPGPLRLRQLLTTALCSVLLMHASQLCMYNVLPQKAMQLPTPQRCAAAKRAYPKGGCEPVRYCGCWPTHATFHLTLGVCVCCASHPTCCTAFPYRHAAGGTGAVLQNVC